MPAKTLIFVPTYNERGNAPRMCEEIHKLGLDADVLFIDDGSPDGTGDLLESLKPKFPRLFVKHRSGKLGIGSAHFDGIKWAYENGYQLLVTLDCDFTHFPSDIPALIAAVEKADVAVGSRWKRKDSLADWNIYRRCITGLGHWLTRKVLGIKEDASGAFRAYRLDRVPQELFGLLRSTGYSFFFESLFILHRNRFAISEVPIVLPARTYGHSKMSTSDVWKSALYIFKLYLYNLRNPEEFLLGRTAPAVHPELKDPQNWDEYWKNDGDRTGTLYSLIAAIYRRSIIKRNLEQTIHRVFPPGSALLHAGCGSGQLDTDLQHVMQITALDISPGALRRYCRNNPKAADVKHGTIHKLPFPDETFDGVYNLGVVEHFTKDEIVNILAEFRRVLKPNGKIVLFWPHARATSVLSLNAVHFLLNRVLRMNKRLHPQEISLCTGKNEVQGILEKTALRLIDYRFGIRDFFVQAVILAEKQNAPNASHARRSSIPAA